MSELTETESPKSKPRLSRQQKWVLVGILVINLCLYGTVWYLSQGSGSNESATVFTATVSEPLALRPAYRQALALALNWQPDAQVCSAMTSWQVASGNSLTLGRSAWAFQFYSPAQRQIQTITVDHGGAGLGRMQAAKTAPQQVMPDWDLESQELLLTFLGYGGQEFLDAHPSANMHLQLKADGTERSVWYVTAVDPGTRQTLTIVIDARSREVVSGEANRGGG